MSQGGFEVAMVGGRPQQIHVKLTADVHQRLRVRCALEDTTIQAFVEQLVAQAVADTQFPETTK